MSDAIDPKVILRIQKMLNLARCGGATEAEAETAMAHAEATMRKYNLTMAEVEASGKSGGEGSKRTKEGSKGRAQYEFQRNLMQICAEVNYCMALVTSTWTGSRSMASGFVLIGREANVIATRELYDYLATTTERLAFEYVGSDNRQRLSRSAVSFKAGCAERLGERLRERHQAALETQAREARERNAAAQHPGAASTGTALAIVLRDFAQEEANRNTDLHWGQPEGTTGAERARHTLVNTAYRTASKAVRASLHPDRESLLRVAREALDGFGGLSEDDLHQAAESAVGSHLDTLEAKAARAAETPAQRAKREAKERRDNEKFWERHHREQQAHHNRTDWRAKDAGASAGDRVGLDKQIDEGVPLGRLR